MMGKAKNGGKFEARLLLVRSHSRHLFKMKSFNICQGQCPWQRLLPQERVACLKHDQTNVCRKLNDISRSWSRYLSAFELSLIRSRLVSTIPLNGS
jgi:hypothetical protein